MVETAKVTSKGQITVPADVRLRLGLIEGSRVLFIEQGNGFLVVNENRASKGGAKSAKAKSPYSSKWSKEYIEAVKAFGDTPDETFVEPEDIPWTEREDLF